MKACKKIVLALALALVLVSSSVYALGLGQIRVKSALNEPLNAEIPVLSATPEELRNLSVSLASSEDFARAGIRASRLEIPLQFKVEKRPGGTVIVVTTEQPVGDPALDFLIEINWSKGKLLREYSVLLDPPGMAPASANRPVAQTAPARTAAKAEPSATTTPGRSTQTSAGTAPATPAARSAPSIAPGDEYTAAAGDTAWGIASRATSAGNINRMMLAIRTANPDAFYKDNINALKRGAVLRIPNRAEMDRISMADARAEVMRQNEIWSNPEATAPSMLAANAAGSVSSSANASSNRNDGQLQLLPPGSDGGSGAGRSGVSGGTGDAAVAGLKQDLARANESLKSQQQQSSDLQARVTDLESIKDKNQRLLSMKNAEIAELQQKLAEANTAASASSAEGQLRKDIFAGAASAAAATSVTVAEVSSASEPTATSAAAISAELPATAQSAAELASATSTPVAASSVAVQATEPVVAATIAPPATEAEVTPPVVTTQPTAAEEPWYMQTWAWLVGVLLILGLILAAVFARRGKSDVARQDRLSSALVDEPTEHSHDDDSEDEYALIEEIEEHPEELSLHLELASLYYAHRDQDKFEATAETMHTHVDDPQQPEWQQVRAMGEELCPDHPLFSGLHSDGVSTLGSAVSGDIGSAASARPSREDPHGYNFDFDLTPASGTRADGTQGAHDGEASGFAGEDVHDDMPSLSDLAGHRAAEGTSFDAGDDDDEAIRATDRHGSHVDGDEFGLAGDGDGGFVDDEGFSSDPVDTKLDLARAYQDMGDDEGARAMLQEVIQEGSEAQQDVARKLLDELG